MPPSDFGEGYSYPGIGSTPPSPRAPHLPSGPPSAHSSGHPPSDAAVNHPADSRPQQSPSVGPASAGTPYGWHPAASQDNDAPPNTVWGAPHADPHADYHRQAAIHFGRTTHPEPNSSHPHTGAAPTQRPHPGAAPGYYAPPRYGSPGTQLPPALSGEKVFQWLAAPGRLKLVAGAVGGFIALILFLSGGSDAKIAALVLVIAVWAICFRHGYHEKAGLHAQTRLAADEAIRTAVDIANTLRGPLSSVQFNGSAPERADFTVRGGTWKPLNFHVALKRDLSGWTFLSTHLDSWTWRRQRIYFIPVPLTKSMDGYGLYKAFGDRLLTELQRRDPSTNGTFHARPPTQ